MKAPVRSHGFDKPSDLEDELAQFDEERVDPELNDRSRAAPSTRPLATATHHSLQRQIDDIRRDLEALRREIEGSGRKPSAQPKKDSELSTWLPVVRSVAVTSLAGRVFSSSPIMAILVAAIPFALGLSAGSK